eukprot:c8579_g2_i1 orf=3-173(-)
MSWLFISFPLPRGINICVDHSHREWILKIKGLGMEASPQSVLVTCHSLVIRNGHSQS